MSLKRYIILLAISIISSSSFFIYPKKVKQSLKVFSQKEKTTAENNLSSDNVNYIHINAGDVFTFQNEDMEELTFDIDQIKFAGYDKEVNSSKESFIIVNNSLLPIISMSVEIIYTDMDGRMLHLRELDINCEVPPGQSRRKDIASWDSQHTYYYYLGNEPKKVATPFKVEFRPLIITIENPAH